MTAANSFRKKKNATNHKYKEFLSAGPSPKDSLSNPFNLFDDSNEKDEVWLISTQKYLLGRQK